jgi:ABC-type nitrate/sulfonate/bicarbonate transport system substrate-binding protein
VARDTQFVTATDPPAAVNLLLTRQVEALIIWEPVLAQLELQGPFRILVTQQQLWERASGSRLTQVHVVYLTTPDIAQQYPQLLRDINDAQREAADMWNRRDEAAITSIMEITQLPRDVVVRAMSRTTILHGLTDDQMNLMIEQLRFNREHGTVLRSDVWNDAAKVKSEFFLRV